jgi:tetratricopeptide (TPR) repeat protein
LRDTLEYFKKAAFQANLSEDQDLEVKCLFNMAVLHESTGSDVASANELYRKILEIDPLNHMALNNLAVNLKSLDMIKRAQGLCPCEVTTTVNLGLLEYQED